MLHFGDCLERLEKCEIDFYHVDIMDGHFVPNLSMNFELMQAVKSVSDKPLEVHLMVTNPEEYIDKLADIGVTYCSFHLETTSNPIRLLTKIHNRGMKGGVVINPLTSEDAVKYILDYLDIITIMTVEPGFSGQTFIRSQLPKIEAIRQMCGDREILLSVDGNITCENAKIAMSCGAEVMVLGTSVIFKENVDYASEVQKFRQYVSQ